MFCSMWEWRDDSFWKNKSKKCRVKLCRSFFEKMQFENVSSIKAIFNETDSNSIFLKMEKNLKFNY